MSQSEARWRIPEWNQELDDGKLFLLREYHLDLIKWTKKINLISPSTLIDADEVHFSDSLQGLKLFVDQLDSKNSIFDLGSGNGFPGVVLSILRPDVEVVCVDSDERKMGFIKQLGLRLKLKNLKTMSARIETLPSNSISCGMSRALGSVDRVLELLEGKASSESRIFHFKGADWERELNDVDLARTKDWQTNLLGLYNLPIGGETRAILTSRRL